MDKDVEKIYKELKNTDKNAINHTFELSKEIYERELDRSNWSDDKSNMLLPVIGIIAGLLFFGFNRYSEIKSELCSDQYYIFIVLASLVIILLFVSMILLINSLRSRGFNLIKKKDIDYIHSIDNDIDIDRYVASLYLNCYQKNIKVINKKVTSRNIATYSMFGGIIIIFILIIFVIIVY